MAHRAPTASAGRRVGETVTSTETGGEPCDLVLAGARVIDPESGLDDVRHVGITGSSIVSVTRQPPAARRSIDLTGLVLAPGFIDLHSHAQTVTGHRLQALDGVTTALDLEGGAMPVGAALAAAGERGRPLNYGFSASWALARLHELDGVELPDGREGRPASPLGVFQRHQHSPRWQRPAPALDVDRILARLTQAIEEGAIGVGVLVGYSPDSGRIEFFRLAQLAAELGMPVFTHGRFVAAEDPRSALEGALEIVGVATGTGAAIHMCHINSTYSRVIEPMTSAVAAARARGVRITTEAYPYTASSTGIGAAFLDPAQLRHRGMATTAIRYLATGERVADEARLMELRRSDPGGLCVIDYLDPQNPADLALLHRAVTFEDTAVASDSMPLLSRAGGDPASLEDVWPVPADAFAHPRSAGCFSRAIGHIALELGLLSLAEVVRRCTLLPAQILEEAVPAMRRKGRISPGADADITVFDPARIRDRATFEELAASVGIEHVLVGGEFVVHDGQIQLDALPGRPVTAGGAS